jgi:tellurite resistance protein TerC
MDGSGSPVLWAIFAAVIEVMLFLDLGVFHRRAHTIRTTEATIWTVVWVALALAFNAFVAWWLGIDKGTEFFTGYLIEKALSVDNLLVIYVIFESFRIEPKHQHRVLFWGILGAIVMRTIMVFAGTALLARFHWLIYLFGGVLILTGLRMLVRREDEIRPEETRAYRFLMRVTPTTTSRDGRMLVREGGRWLATPLFVVLMLIELGDVVFAVDSIFAIFAITVDPFIVLTSNIFAVLGMRSLYFVLARLAGRFEYLQPGLALVMLFVGGKMALSDVFKVPVVVSLLVVALLLAGSVVASLVRQRRQAAVTAPPPPAPPPREAPASS